MGLIAVVRGATAADLPAIVAFQLAMAAETEDMALQPETVAAGVQRLHETSAAGFYLVAEVDGEVGGSLMVTPEWTDWRNGWYWWVQSVYVRPAFRRRGLYRMLYDAVKQRAAADPGIRGFRLYVERGNTAARLAYERLGMVETAYRLYEEPR